MQYLFTLISLVLIVYSANPNSNVENVGLKDWTGKVNVVVLGGSVVVVETSSVEMVSTLIEKYESIIQQTSQEYVYRIAHNGVTLDNDTTLGDQGVQPGDVLHAILISRIGNFGIGNWPGSDLLEDLNGDIDPSQVTADQVNKLIQEIFFLHAVTIPESSTSGEPYTLVNEVLDEKSRQSIISELDSHHSEQDDLKYQISKEKLVSLIGDKTYSKLEEIYGTQPEEIWLRRVETEKPDQGINWHLDRAIRTMQVALNGDDEYEGGKLVFAYNGKIYMPDRKPGSATIHDNTIVHGVTPIGKGPRYGVFFLKFNP